ncbi:dihydrofolate reductase [Clostridium sp. cel8]|jgi:dihydrofolate reductase|uniref:dihydrofolate reductase n=1 Tax=unclassified Clostridium TaxID=2614128 RepID=UPI0015F5B137|nr:dihydrofolate reductase [Clostridium sp. cel8]MBA5850161.1 dihydrofolate reductase [Clostridium sp. cel8]
MLSIIAALNQDFIIGRDNNLIWHISRDLKRFKKITSGKTIVMGRKTFESLPGVLPNRKHIVITRDKNYTVKEDSVLIIHDINDILKYKDSKEEVFIIGGGEIYRQFIPYCKKLYLTEIISNETGDTYFPKFNREDYTVIEKETHLDDNINYSFTTLEKKKL